MSTAPSTNEAFLTFLAKLAIKNEPNKGNLMMLARDRLDDVASAIRATYLKDIPTIDSLLAEFSTISASAVGYNYSDVVRDSLEVARLINKLLSPQ